MPVLVLVLMLRYNDSAVMGLILGVRVICGAGITTIDVKKRFYFIKSHNFLEGLVI